jgi:hypothetical protein
LEHLTDVLVTQDLLDLELTGDIFLDRIDLALTGSPVILLAILAAVVVVALGARLLLDRRRKVGEGRRPYSCISASMAWGISKDGIDQLVERRQGDRITKLNKGSNS